MKQQRAFRRWHRWLAVITALQLLAWTASGVFFAFVDIDHVRGEGHVIPMDGQRFEPASLAFEAREISTLRIIPRLPGEWVAEVRPHDADLEWLSLSGDPLPALTRDQALTLGSLRTDLAPDTAEWVDSGPLAAEYRGRPLPLWRVYSSSDASTVAYLHASSGEVVAIRNTAWRWWDFLWSLHIMDYDDRDTIGTVLLKVFSVLALVTAVAGIVLFVLLPKKFS
jgi:hypothetical protein